MDTYIDGTIDDALARDYDTIQLKYDGWYAQVSCGHQGFNLYSATGRPLFERFWTEPLHIGILYGEYMYGTQWAQAPNRKGLVYLFDMETTVSSIYKERYAQLVGIADCIPGFSIVQNFRIQAFKDVWNTYVLGDALFEGVVFRRSTDYRDAVIIRQKKRVTADLRCVALIEGQGKHAGRLGALVGESKDGVQVKVGGGFTDAQREVIWANQELYVNQWFEIEAKLQFSSGSYRHPQFLRWREDKSTLTG